MKKFWKRTEGFTLVELIVVIAILGILAGIGTVGYSGYVKKANMAADEQLASNVKNALLLAHYDNALTAGDYVVVKYDGSAVAKNSEDDTVTTADTAMIAAFGSNYADSLKLKYNEWELGVVADAEKMGYVNASTYNSSGLSNLLGQVQSVVNAAGNYFSMDGVSVDGSLLEYLSKTDIELGEGNSVAAKDASAVANVAVFSVADTIANTNVSADEQFYAKWVNGVLTEDSVANEAAKYALILGMATYIDKTAGTTYVSQLEVSDETLAADPMKILNARDAVAQKMMSENQTLCTQYMGTGDTDAQGYKDAMAFLAYMDGVKSSSDTMLTDYDIYNPNYFSDGTMESYVQNYINTGAVLNDLGVSKDAFVFIYDGMNILCTPLDY